MYEVFYHLQCSTHPLTGGKTIAKREHERACGKWLTFPPESAGDWLRETFSGHPTSWSAYEEKQMQFHTDCVFLWLETFSWQNTSRSLDDEEMKNSNSTQPADRTSIIFAYPPSPRFKIAISKQTAGRSLCGTASSSSFNEQADWQMDGWPEKLSPRFKRNRRLCIYISCSAKEVSALSRGHSLPCATWQGGTKTAGSGVYIHQFQHFLSPPCLTVVIHLPRRPLQSCHSIFNFVAPFRPTLECRTDHARATCFPWYANK